MRPVPATVKAPRLPQVNLIPLEIGQRRAQNRLRIVMLLAVILFTMVVVGLGVGVGTLKSAAEADVRVLEEELQRLQTEAAQYSDVPVVKAALSNAQHARAYASASEIYFSELYIGLIEATPSNIVIDRIAVSRAQLTTDGPVSPNPFSTPDVGFVSMIAYSNAPIDLVAFTEALEQIPWLEQVRLNSSRRDVDTRVGGDNVTVYYVIEATGRINANLLTERFRSDVDDVDTSQDQGEEQS